MVISLGWGENTIGFTIAPLQEGRKFNLIFIGRRML